ncbi:hypothetical protein C8R41DRAFT_898717 [Lentinula lateritia]|uniref:CxC2-like cysteine cluster KDZ transposase-associated domain-containing protein n=1 Tax=Lentinula lateritia TaxID=40482 RepID=A0ABQ8V0R5_9AGAR|nr:hypothetical protein C8R41DRAFT_898717 [Lentinula lateritia]
MSVNESAPRHCLYTNYKISRKTTLSVVYRYPVGLVLEYPETGTTSEEVVGHLFELGIDNWISPGRDFTYPRGEPRGNSKECVTNPLLLDSTTGVMVPCIVRHSTCQGVKIYNENMTHSLATREQLRDLMQHSKEQQMETSAYLTAIRRVGCTSEANLGQDASESLLDRLERIALRRGYPEMPNCCTGGLIFQWSFDGTPYIKCEHHSRFHNRDHFYDNTIGNGRFNVEYLEAVLTNDHDKVGRIELEAQLDGYGPRTSCHMVTNNTSQRLTCTWDHRDQEDGSLKQPNLISTGCHCTFREYEPLEEYRSSCPYLLITSRGSHSHLIPLPQKTPTKVKLELESLFEKMEVELADLRLKYLKAQQDSSLEPDAHYVRAVIEIPITELQLDENDLVEDQPGEVALQPLRIAICMTLEASRRFVKTQYLQSDIGFKRIMGFYEFEVASIDRYSNTSITLCRVYLNHQTAHAHRLWRHLHGYNIDDYDGLILNWVVDHHRGQAKGIGLYVHDLACSLAPKTGFHQPLRLIQDLKVRGVMRGLICVQHDDWDGALEQIRTSGGKAAQNWLWDKETSGFVFPASCWEKSYIPFDIWNARLRESNVVEVVHANVNMEGTQCTLVGGVHKGKHYDLLKQRSLINHEDFGIHESYSSKHSYENAMKNHKRKAHGRKKNLHQEDGRIKLHNKKMVAAHTKWQNARARV